MGSKDVSVDYLSTGANRQTAVADWSKDGLLAFGADSNIAVWAPSADIPRGITRLLRGHEDAVKAVAFLPPSEGDEFTYLITGSDDKTLILWKAEAGTRDFTACHTVSDHAGPINCITALRIGAASSSPEWLVATGSADASIKVWSCTAGKLQLLQSIKTSPKFFPLALSISYLDDDKDAVVLSAAGTRDVIQILTSESTAAGELEFKVQANLTGHGGWIRSLDFARESLEPDSDLLLASASQDKYVRIWRIRKGTALPALTDGADPSSGAYLPGKSPSNKAHRLKVAAKDFSVSFEALLLGHEDWIYSSRWHRQQDGKLQLLTTSADNSLAIWEADPGSGIWVSMVRLGEISREKGATTATGSTGGFWTGLWSPDGKSVACLGRTGSWRRWQYITEDDAWKPAMAVMGHVRAVSGISWSRDGAYLLSTSSDQTTRLHMQWKASGANTWHEMSRPQIHGYDLNCIDSLGDTQFVSGADEKLMRVFGKPRAVASMLAKLQGSEEVEDTGALPDAANMPVLGLSNKAIDTADEDQEIAAVDDRDREAMDPATVVKKSYLEIDHPPLEETLSRHTLWPEIEKLYGHGYELSCLAASHDGKLVASACKASSTNHAVIRLFETERWVELRPPLTAHSLTATRLRFSQDDRYLLSVGRDRQWAVFERTQDGEQPYRLLQANTKGHSRMILDAAWAPTQAPMFATAGRDKQVRIWGAKEGDDGKTQFAQLTSLPCDGPATAVDFLPRRFDDKLVLAVGTEAGNVTICTLEEDASGLKQVTLPINLCLPKAVLQLAWRRSVADTSRLELAIAGEDSSLRIYSFSAPFLSSG